VWHLKLAERQLNITVSWHPKPCRLADNYGNGCYFWTPPRCHERLDTPFNYPSRCRELISALRGISGQWQHSEIRRATTSMENPMRANGGWLHSNALLSSHFLRSFLIAGNVSVYFNDKARSIGHKNKTFSSYWPASVDEDAEDTEHCRHLSLQLWLRLLKIQNIIVTLACECGWGYWRYRTLSSP